MRHALGLINFSVREKRNAIGAGACANRAWWIFNIRFDAAALDVFSAQKTIFL